MNVLSEEDIKVIVKKVVENISVSEISSQAGQKNIARDSSVFETVDEAVKKAHYAQKLWDDSPLSLRTAVAANIRIRLTEANRMLSEMAAKETGMGRSEDKVLKNKLVIDKTPGPEILTPIAFSGDNGLTITERAPYGVIGCITPTTNPSETIICNAIAMISGGNSVVFNPHPKAKKTSIETVKLINQAIVEAGGNENLVTTVYEPTVDSAKALMSHPNVRILTVTGGGAVVREAMKSGKKAICAGPGNPPAVVDETADMAKAAKDIISGHSLDNNIICIAEKEIIAVDKIVDVLKSEMLKNGGVEIKGYHIKELERVVLDAEGHPNKGFIGKNAEVLLKEIGIDADSSVRTIFMEVEADHPFVQEEMMMPVLPIVRVKDALTAIGLAKEVEHGCGHTAVMHSKNIENLHKMARTINTSIFVKNGPSYAGVGMGGEGYTSFTIASPTGEGLTTAITFTRERRCTLSEYFRII